jgi:hypothetical protein
MYCVLKGIVRGNEAHVINADFLHPSCTNVKFRRKFASPVHNELKKTLIRGSDFQRVERLCELILCILGIEKSDLDNVA